MIGFYLYILFTYKVTDIKDSHSLYCFSIQYMFFSVLPSFYPANLNQIMSHTNTISIVIAALHLFKTYTGLFLEKCSNFIRQWIIMSTYYTGICCKFLLQHFFNAILWVNFEKPVEYCLHNKKLYRVTQKKLPLVF